MQLRSVFVSIQFCFLFQFLFVFNLYLLHSNVMEA